MKAVNVQVLAFSSVVIVCCYIYAVTSGPTSAESAAHVFAPRSSTVDARPVLATPVPLASAREVAVLPEIEQPAATVLHDGAPARGAGERWAVSNLSPEAKFTLEYLQGEIEELLPYMKGEARYEDEAQYGRAAKVVAMYSAMVVIAAEGQAIPGSAYSALSPEERRILAARALMVSNNGLKFLIHPEVFSAFDQIQTLLEVHSNAVPVENVPFDQIVALARDALSYRIP